MFIHRGHIRVYAISLIISVIRYSKYIDLLVSMSLIQVNARKRYTPYACNGRSVAVLYDIPTNPPSVSCSVCMQPPFVSRPG